MRARIESISLTGTSRIVEFRPGLNIITGPITTGKTTLMRLCRALLGSRYSQFPPEVRDSSWAVAGSVLVGDERFAIVRPLVSTASANVEIAGTTEVHRLPASGSRGSYNGWLLRKLGLPIIEVPSAPTKADSEPSPVTINDYFLYCDLTQSEIDDSVFGHHDPFKNIKRKYVFEILYGIYGVELASLHEELRELEQELRSLQADQKTLERVLVDTPWANRALLVRELEEAVEQLTGIEAEMQEGRDRPNQPPLVEELRNSVQAIELEASEQEKALQFERLSVDRLEELTNQLRAQSSRLVRSIVSESRLLDFEFVVCPRCGTPVDDQRGSDTEVCLLCLQEPSPKLSKEDLIRERERLESQIVETEELIAAHKANEQAINARLAQLSSERAGLVHELNFQMRSYLSDTASTIAQNAADRARAQERVFRLRDYSSLFLKLDEARRRLAFLEDRRTGLQEQLEIQRIADDDIREKIEFLENTLADILDRFHVPVLGAGSRRARIDPKTYLPQLDGRRFDDLHSQGLKVMVNVAHALAHQLTGIAKDTNLPNILFIDGLTSNIGHREGLDQQRVAAIYSYLAEMSERFGERLQIIVADNDVPPEARGFVSVEFDEGERLVPGLL